MIKMKVKLDKPEDIVKLNTAAQDMPFDIDVCSGWYVVDAKSLVGLFGLRMREPVIVKIYTSMKEANLFLQRIHEMIL